MKESKIKGGTFKKEKKKHMIKRRKRGRQYFRKWKKLNNRTGHHPELRPPKPS